MGVTSRTQAGMMGEVCLCRPEKGIRTPDLLVRTIQMPVHNIGARQWHTVMLDLFGKKEVVPTGIGETITAACK